MQAADPPVVDATDADFAQVVLEESKRRPVVVDFWAGWCRPCLVLGPVLERIADEHAGAFLLVKVDVDANQVSASQFGVQSIPNVWAFRDGRPVDQFIGALPEPAVREWIGRLLPTEADAGAERAVEAEREGRLEDAERGYRDALQADGGNRVARLGLGRVLAQRGELEEARELVGPLLPDPEAERVLAAIRVAGWSEADGSDPVARGKAAAAEGRWEDALQALLPLVKEQEEAKRAVLDVFAVLGDDDPVTRTYRPRLANALY
ncbi:MAG: tetratricopeptide repeat protein [Actinomycetota bacterium]